jgi:hypothetical protein
MSSASALAATISQVAAPPLATAAVAPRLRALSGARARR